MLLLHGGRGTLSAVPTLSALSAVPALSALPGRRGCDLLATATAMPASANDDTADDHASNRDRDATDRDSADGDAADCCAATANRDAATSDRHATASDGRSAAAEHFVSVIRTQKTAFAKFTPGKMSAFARSVHGERARASKRDARR